MTCQSHEIKCDRTHSSCTIFDGPCGGYSTISEIGVAMLDTEDSFTLTKSQVIIITNHYLRVRWPGAVEQQNQTNKSFLFDLFKPFQSVKMTKLLNSVLKRNGAGSEK